MQDGGTGSIGEIGADRSVNCQSEFLLDAKAEGRPKKWVCEWVNIPHGLFPATLYLRDELMRIRCRTLWRRDRRAEK